MRGPLFCMGVTLLAGCARLAPGQVADGVARLTVRQLGGVMIAIEGDTSCGFSSEAVLDQPSVTGDIGEMGTATWTVEDCTIDLGTAPVDLNTDCNGVATRGRGSFTITATKTVRGQVTGDLATPVVPVAPDAATFQIDKVTFRDFEVTKDGSDSWMRVVEGGLSARITPLLAVDDTDGACSIVSPNAAFEDIVWRPSTVNVTAGKRDFEVDVRGGALEATNGTVGGRTNHVAGTLVLWGSEREVSLSGASNGLDPDYDPEVFEASYVCGEGLQLPVSYECPLEPRLAEGVARLTIKNLGLIIRTTDLDTSCGFGSLAEQVSELIGLGTLVGLITGEPETLVFDAEECALGAIDPPHLIYTDCLDTQYSLEGSAVVTGSKTVTGKIVLDDDPLQPQDRTSAIIEMARVELTEVTPGELPVGADALEPHLTMHTGVLSGTYYPVSGEAADTPEAYFIVIPVGRFERIRLTNADVTLQRDGLSFPMHVDDTELYAFTGGYLGDANWLYGSVTIDGTTWPIGSETDPIPLDPDYDQATFDRTYECTENLAAPAPVDGPGEP